MIYDKRMLLYFRTIMEERSISKASDKLYISQSSLSKYLKIIEDELGTKLIDRSTIPITFTLAGEKFLSYLEKTSDLYNNLLCDISQCESTIPREITIGVSSMNSRMIIEAFPSFYSRYPNTQLTLLEEHTEKLHRLLFRKKIDVAILVRNGLDLANPNHEFEVLITQKRLIVVSTNNPLAKLASKNNSLTCPDHIDIQNLQNQKLIAGKSGQKIFEDMNEMVKKYHLTTQGFLETQSIDAMVSLAKKNFGITFIPQYYLKRFSSLDGLVFFYSEHPEFQWALTLESRSYPLTLPEKDLASMLKHICNNTGKP